MNFLFHRSKKFFILFTKERNSEVCHAYGPVSCLSFSYCIACGLLPQVRQAQATVWLGKAADVFMGYRSLRMHAHHCNQYLHIGELFLTRVFEPDPASTIYGLPGTRLGLGLY
jgi:hypothetical protein